jgi:hypothetical protein
MSDEEPLNAADRELEAALGGLHPQPAAIDRDRMMFEAGRRTVRHRPIAWQVVSGALAAALVISISLHREPREVERVVYVTSPSREVAPEPVAVAVDAGARRGEPAAEGSYLALRELLLEGSDAVERRPRAVVPAFNPRSRSAASPIARPRFDGVGESL